MKQLKECGTVIHFKLLFSKQKIAKVEKFSLNFSSSEVEFPFLE